MKTREIIIIISIISLAAAGPLFAQAEDAPPEWMPELAPPTVTTSEATPPASPQPPVTEELVFSDVPDIHWARSAVYDLVKMGISQGYPDGTFRGSRKITRYETAMFLSKMSIFIDQRMEEIAEIRQKNFDENQKPKLQAEIDAIKAEIEKLKEPDIPRPELGYFEGRLKVGNFTSIGDISSTEATNVGPRFDPRLVLRSAGWVNGWLYAEGTFDTMDGMWGGSPSRALVTEMMDVTARAKTRLGMNVVCSVGPGPIVHTEGSRTAFPADDGTVFMRPWNSIGLEGGQGRFYWHAKYASIARSVTGEAEISDYSMKLGFDFDEDTSFMGISDISTTMDYNVRNGSDPADVFKQRFAVLFEPKWGFEFAASGGYSSVSSEGENYYFDARVKFKDLLKKGLSVEIKGLRVGSDFINYPTHLGEEWMLGLNYFDRYAAVPGGGADVGVMVVNDVADYLRLTVMSDIVLDHDLSYGKDRPGTYSMYEVRAEVLTYTFASFGFHYRVYHEPGRAELPTSDTFVIDGRYEF